MKKFSKILSVALLVALVLSLGVASAFADANAQHTITITPVAGQRGAHTYTAYQVFAGDYDNGKLSNVTWGKGVDGDAILTALQNDTTHFQIPDTSENAASGATVNAFAKCSSAADVAQAISDANVGNNSDFIKAFSDVVGAHLSGTEAGHATAAAADETHNQTQNAVITVTGDGYYIVLDTTTTVPEGEARTDYILQVLDNVTIQTKSSTTTSEKHVDDQNDSNATDHSELKDSADYDIGDEVPYTISMTLPADFANYNKYEVVFYDDMSKGLTYKAGSAMVKYGDAEAVALEPTNGTATYTDGHMYVWNLGDVRNNANLSAGKTITITYKAILNEFAVIGVAGNPNKMYVEFSNNPNGTGNGKTPDDINIVFTYKTVFNKVDGEQKPLTGADFTLYKKVVDATETDGYRWVDVTALNTGTDAKNPSKVKSDKTNGTETVKDCVFTFSGLDAGDYKLEEIATPPGYNSINPIEFTITATHQLESADPRVTALTGTDGHEFNMTPVKDGNNFTGELDANIVNQSGATLPSTGGIGTTIFYVVGGVLVLAAIILLVTKKRMSE